MHISLGHPKYFWFLLSLFLNESCFPLASPSDMDWLWLVVSTRNQGSCCQFSPRWAAFFPALLSSSCLPQRLSGGRMSALGLAPVHLKQMPQVPARFPLVDSLSEGRNEGFYTILVSQKREMCVSSWNRESAGNTWEPASVWNVPEIWQSRQVSVPRLAPSLNLQFLPNAQSLVSLTLGWNLV